MPESSGDRKTVLVIAAHPEYHLRKRPCILGRARQACTRLLDDPRSLAIQTGDNAFQETQIMNDPK